MHDGLDEACARLLNMADQPASGGTPTSVIVTIGLEELLTKAGLAETSDGTNSDLDQLLRIADEAEIWPTIINHTQHPPRLRKNPTNRHPRPNHGPPHPRRRMSASPGAPIHPAGATDTT